MRDSFLGLRHYRIISCDYYNSDVCNFSTPGTHSGKCLMAGSIEESNGSSVFYGYLVCPDMLGNSPGFACYYVGMADIIEQGGFPVIHVSHDGYNGWPCYKILRIFLFLFLLYVAMFISIYKFYFIIKFTRHQFYYICFQSLIDGNHDAKAHTFTDNIGKTYIHQVGKFTNGNK